MNRLVAFLFLIGFLASCGDDRQQFEYAGGKISMCLESSFQSKEPSEIGDYYSQFILGQVFEGLTSLIPSTLEVRPQLAKKYTVLNNGLSYEFELRDNVEFHSLSGIGTYSFVQKDVVYSIEKACSKSVNDIPTTAYQMVFKGP